MPKVTLGPRTILYPLPIILVGANVDGKPDFMAAAFCGIVNGTPPMMTVSLQHPRHTLKGIQENNTFSINIASVDYVKETDYCGTTTGAKTDKVADCKFKVFFGKLKTAPLIEQYPVNVECRVVQMINLGSHELIIGQVEEVYINDNCLTNGQPDVDKIRPFLYSGTRGEYREFGRPIGPSFSIGKQIKA
jgi:flavin reductase (DIM6/NTAB) family NADH-FMN oxidoreductase RutF